MIQYNRLNTKLSNFQLNKLKSAIKNETESVLRLSPNMIGDSNQQINFTANLDRAGNTRIYLILEEAKETKFEFSKGNVKVL